MSPARALEIFLIYFLHFFLLQPSTTADPMPAPIVGKECQYSLGTSSDPVIANEYNAFLNSQEEALDGTSFFEWKYSCFYEPSFMNCSSVQFSDEHYDTNESDCIRRLNKYHFRYSVIDGRGEYIIAGLSKVRADYPAIHVAELFKQWRKYPRAEEIADYFNRKIDGREEEAETIKKKYIQPTEPLSTKEVSSLREEFDFIDGLVMKAYPLENSPLTHQEILDEQGRCFLIFREEVTTDLLEQGEKKIRAMTIPELKYLRPISWKIVTS